jgi:NAD(P)-dependent dehydrogenase (short-subunit alcohol dehydrogenase family)
VTESTLQSLFGVTGKVALVVGASPAGLAAASLLQAAGAAVTTLPTQPDETGTGLDLNNEAAVADAVNRVAAEHAALDIVVYAATRPGTYSFTEMTLGQWDALQCVNLRGAFLVLREAVRHMGTRGGRIVAISTMGSVHPVLHGNEGYGAAKAGLNALIRSIALDYAAQGILANTVLPGAIPVGALPADAISAGGPARQPGRLMLGMGTAEDVAAAVLYLVSPAGKFITGQELMLDGGFLIS